MKIKIFLTAIVFTGIMALSSVQANEKMEHKGMMMQEHHALMDELMSLMKDMIVTMKDISTDEKIRGKTDEQLKRIDALIGKHAEMKEKMPQHDHMKHKKD